MIWFAAFSLATGACLAASGRSVYAALLASLALSSVATWLLVADAIGWSAFALALLVAVFGVDLAYLAVAALRLGRRARTRSGA